MNQSINDSLENKDELLLSKVKSLINSCDIDLLKTSFYDMYITWTISDNADCSYDRKQKSNAISSFLEFLNKLS